MTIRIRQIAVGAFALTVAAALTGASLRAETSEPRSADSPRLADVCLTANWPMIPAECLDGAEHRTIRLAISNDAPKASDNPRVAALTSDNPRVAAKIASGDMPKIAMADMAERFEVAFR